MSKVYGKSLGMSPYVSLKISHISLISLISPILREAKQKKVPDITTDVRDSTLKKKAASYSPALHCSTIGAGGLNFSVRNGKRWNPAAITT